jgi:hypothetical protein
MKVPGGIVGCRGLKFNMKVPVKLLIPGIDGE